MPWFKRTNPTTVPSWCRLAPDEWVRFRDALQQALHARGDAVPPEESATVTIRQLDGCTVEIGLDRLVNEVCNLPLAEWAPTIEGYFADQQAEAEVIRRSLLGQDFAYVRSLLRPRLLCRDLLSVGEVGLRRDLGADLVAVLEVEGPQTLHRITPTDAAAWGVPADELWSIALANLRQEDHEITRHDRGSWVTGSSNYVASHALRLGELLVDPAPYGVLVAVPHPFMVLFLPMSANTLPLLPGLPRAVDDLHGGEFGALSRHIYWWTDGVFEHVGIAEDDDNLTITGSEQFAALVNLLGGKRGGDSAPAAKSSLLLARSPAESHIYMDLHPCACGEANFPRNSFSVVEVAGDLASRHTGSCAGCGAMREFLFRLPQEPSLGGPIFGYGGPSELLDAGEWRFVADRYARIVPAQVSPGTEAARVARQQLATAEAAMGEVLAFVPKGADAVPYEALWSDRGRAVYNAEPDRFSRDRLEAVRDTYRQILAEMDAAAG